MKRFFIACGLFLAATTHAEVEVRASLQAFKVELIDLDTSDGVAPSLVSIPGNPYYYGASTLDIEGFDGFIDSLLTKHEPFTSLTRTLTLAKQEGHFYMKGSHIGEYEAGARVKSWVDSVNGPAEWSFTRATVQQLATYRLSPKTQVKIVAEYSAAGYSASPEVITFHSVASGSANIFANIAGQPFVHDSTSVMFDDEHGVFSFDKTGSLSVVLANGGSDYTTMYFTARVESMQRIFVSAVPEPSSIWTALFGVAFIGMRLRRIRN